MKPICESLLIVVSLLFRFGLHTVSDNNDQFIFTRNNTDLYKFTCHGESPKIDRSFRMNVNMYHKVAVNVKTSPKSVRNWVPEMTKIELAPLPIPRDRL